MPAALAPSGYSGTPLAAKLGLKDGMVVAFAALAPTLEPLASAARFARLDRVGDWAGISGTVREYDCIHAFTRQRPEIEAHLGDLQDAIKVDGMIWVSWPKKSSGVTTDVTENVVRDTALSLGLVDIKVCAIDDVWSGLKLVVRKALR